ncbi:MAG TPA: hypothetical protein VIV11_25805 [Kofleriaceae bacterium]
MRPYAAVRVSAAIALVAAVIAVTVVVWWPGSITPRAAEVAITPATEDTSLPSIDEVARVDKPPLIDEAAAVDDTMADEDAPADTFATFVVDRCLLELALDGRVIYRGKPRCRNKESTLPIRIPPSRAALLRKSWHAHYANGGVWAEHDDEWWIPLASHRYRIWEFVEVEGQVIDDSTPEPDPHHVTVTAKRGHEATWFVTHFGDKSDTYATGETAAIAGNFGGDHSLFVGKRPGIRYLRKFPGSYRFVVGRRITMSYVPE